MVQFFFFVKKKLRFLFFDCFFMFLIFVSFFSKLAFLLIFCYLHSGRSKVTRVTVGRDTKVFEFVKLMLRP